MSNNFPNQSNSDFNKAPAQPSFGEEPTNSQISTVHSTSEQHSALAPASGLSWVGLILALFFPPIGGIISIIAFRKAKEEGRKSTVALIGIILGAIGTIFNIIYSIYVMPAILADMSAISEL